MKNEYMKGYPIKEHKQPVKRYCQTLDLKNEPKLIAEYRKMHSQGKIWPEIPAGIREVGILEMEIYLFDNRLFMIVETPFDFDWETAMKHLNTLPRQQEWEVFVSTFQQTASQASSNEKWKMMERIFHLYE